MHVYRKQKNTIEQKQNPLNSRSNIKNPTNVTAKILINLKSPHVRKSKSVRIRPILTSLLASTGLLTWTSQRIKIRSIRTIRLRLWRPRKKQRICWTSISESRRNPLYDIHISLLITITLFINSVMKNSSLY